MAIKHAEFLVRDSLLNPNHTVASLLHILDKSLAFIGKFNGIGSTGAKHHLGRLIDLRDSLDQLADALLAGNATHKQHVRTLGVHTPLGQNAFVESRRIEIRINTVVNHLHAIFRNAVKLHHVLLHALAHRNHTVGSLVSSTLNPATHGVSAVAQLFCLPRTVRFQGMGCEYQRALQKPAGQHTAKMAVPRMAVNHVNILESGRPLEVDIQRLKNLLETVIVGIQPQLAGKSQSMDVVFIHILRTKTARLDMAKLCKFLSKELDVDTCTAINLRRKLISQNSCVHKTTPFPPRIIIQKTRP